MEMHAETKVEIRLWLSAGQSLSDAVGGLPPYARESFVQESAGCWRGDFVISCPVAPVLAEGDLVDDFAPYFSQLLKLRRSHDAEFVLQVAVGPPGPEDFEIPAEMVALFAALGASILVTTSMNPRFAKNKNG